MSSFTDMLDQGAGKAGTYIIINRAGIATRLSRNAIFAGCTTYVTALKSTKAYVGRGNIGILASTSANLLMLVEAIWRVGIPLTMLPPAGRGMGEAAFADQLVRLCKLAGVVTLVMDDSYPRIAAERISGIETLSIDEMAGGQNPDFGESPDDHQTALLQLSSGTTGLPKAVEISHMNLSAHLKQLSSGSDHQGVHDVMISWLPLYHDMGLIGFLALPLACGECNLLLRDAGGYMSNPSLWMRDLAEYGGTATAAPTFAYGLAARSLASMPNVRLNSVRFALVVAFPAVRPGAVPVAFVATSVVGVPSADPLGIVTVPVNTKPRIFFVR